MSLAYLRFAAYGFPGLVAAWTSSWPLAVATFAICAISGLLLERSLGTVFDRSVAFFSALAIMGSVSIADPSGTTDATRLGHFAFSCLAFFALTRKGSLFPRPAVFAIAAGLALVPTLLAWSRASWSSFGPQNLLVGLFGAEGLLYNAPLLWGGYLGLIRGRAETKDLSRTAIAGLVPGTLGLLVTTDAAVPLPQAVTWLPFLLPGLAHCFREARDLAARRPERVLAALSGLLILWNALFMEQYRRLQLPSDDTVSFARVTSNSAGLLSRLTGTPTAWPANWLFARQFDTTPDRWEAVAGRDLFSSGARDAIIELGDDPTPFASDSALLLEGFGDRRTCERGWCRDLDGSGRILLPVRSPGRGDFVIRLRLRGRGTFTMSLDGAATAAAEMTDSLEEIALRVPARSVASGVHVLTLAVDGGGRATLDRLTLERGL